MADGYNRFNSGGQFYYQPQQQHHNQRTLQQSHRNGSPISSSRGLFQPNADTPSPNRSPGTHSPAYNMFNHGNHRQNHGLLNGGSHQSYQPQINLAKQYQSHGAGHTSHHMNNHHGDHNGIGGSANTYSNHQHNSSLSTLSNATPHFTPAHLQNGSTSNAGVLSKPHGDHWNEQIREYEKLKHSGEKAHYYARTTPHVSRVPGSSGNGANDRGEEEGRERRRAADEPEEENVWQAIDFGGQGLKCMAGSLFKYNFLKKIYFNHNKLSYLPVQIGEMRSLTVLDLSFNELYELPPEIGMLTKLKRLLLFENKLSDLPYEVGSLHQLDFLGIEGNPMRNDYVERIADHGTKEFVKFMREQAEPPAPPQPREWHYLGDEAEPADVEKFRVMSWNVLCDRGATQTQYGYAALDSLTWDRRRGAILDEIRTRDADIVALQEVDIESYDEFFRPNLAAEDYKGVFWPKNRAQTMMEKEAVRVDGCATFFKNSKYILLAKEVIVFRKEAIARADMKGSHDIYNRVMNKDHIAVVIFLENRQTGSRLMVVNVHLAWEPYLADVKVIQTAILLEQLKKLADNYAKHPPCTDKEVFRYAAQDTVDGADSIRPEHLPSVKYDDALSLPIVICSDLNSTKDSGVHELVSQGSLASTHKEIEGYSYGDLTRNGMSHPFSLKSSYSEIGELPFTNYTPDFKEVIDYIWFATNALQVTGLLGEVDPEYLKRVPGFPNFHFPSDHLALMVEFAIKGRRERKVVEADFGNGNNGRRDGRERGRDGSR
ncbi:Glucose-repressible alcohol dehydrogenase transcriptional effector [Oleoguttula sp. CCFEE 5521]